MNKILEIYFLRHGETEHNRLKIPQGSEIDTSLNENGIKQSIITAKYLKKFNHVPDIIFSSPMKRSLETAQIIHKELGLKNDIIIENNITEMKSGILRIKKDKIELKKMEKNNNSDYLNYLNYQKLEEEFESIIDPIEKVKFLESERLIKNWELNGICTFQEAKKICDKIIFMIKNCNQNRILIVSHSMILFVLISHIFNIHIEGLAKKYYKNIKNCFISKIIYNREAENESKKNFTMITPPNTEHFLSYNYLGNTLLETKEILGKDSTDFIYLVTHENSKFAFKQSENIDNAFIEKHNLKYYDKNDYGTFYSFN
jgi:broad specificity phosphatase PhoE